MTNHEEAKQVAPSPKYAALWNALEKIARKRPDRFIENSMRTQDYVGVAVARISNTVGAKALDENPDALIALGVTIVRNLVKDRIRIKSGKDGRPGRTVIRPDAKVNGVPLQLEDGADVHAEAAANLLGEKVLEALEDFERTGAEGIEFARRKRMLEALLLKARHGLSDSQIAEELKISKSTVTEDIDRLRKHLRSVLRSYLRDYLKAE